MRLLCRASNIRRARDLFSRQLRCVFAMCKEQRSNISNSIMSRCPKLRELLIRCSQCACVTHKSDCTAFTVVQTRDTHAMLCPSFHDLEVMCLPDVLARRSSSSRSIPQRSNRRRESFVKLVRAY